MSRMFAWNDNIMLDLRSFDLNDNVDLTGMFTNSKSTIGYAKNETIVSKFNDSSVTGIPSTLKFIVKQNWRFISSVLNYFIIFKFNI